MKWLSRPLYAWLAIGLLCALLMSACRAKAPRIAFEQLDFALADAGSGEKLFQQSNNEAPACSACHAVAGDDSGIGNALAGIATVASERVAGQSAPEYLYWSILRPSQHLVAGYADSMYAGYEDSLEAADLADLIAYLLSLR